MLFLISYILFIISTIAYGSFYIGPVSLRQLVAVIMIIVCLRESKKLPFDKYLLGYFFFIIFFGISSVLTGFVDEYIHYVFGLASVVYTTYWATSILIKKYDAIFVLIYVVVFIGLFDSIVTTFQATYNHSFDYLLERIHLDVQSEDFTSKQVREVDMMGISIPGIFGSAVINGQLLLASFLLSLALQHNNFRPIYYVATGVLLIGLFYCQQRGPFFLSISLFVFMLYKQYYSGRALITKIFVVVAITMVGGLFLAFNDESLLLDTPSRYAQGLQDTGRVAIYESTIDWVLNNPWGGIYELMQIKAPHNFFLNAFVYAGWIGGLFIIGVLFMQLKPILRVCKKNIIKKNYITFILAITYIGVTGNAMVHNLSIISGDVISWTIWAAFLANYQSIR